MKSLYENKVYDKLYIKKLDEMLRKALQLPSNIEYYEAFTASRYRDDNTPFGGPYRVLNHDQIEFLKQNYKDVVYIELRSINMGYWVFKK